MPLQLAAAKLQIFFEIRKNLGNNRIKISILKQKWGKCKGNPHEIAGKGRRKSRELYVTYINLGLWKTCQHISII